MKKLFLVFALVCLVFGCQLNPYIDRECEVRSLYVIKEDSQPDKYGMNVEWEQRGSLPTRETFVVNQPYYESLSVGDIVIYSDILKEISY